MTEEERKALIDLGDVYENEPRPSKEMSQHDALIALGDVNDPKYTQSDNKVDDNKIRSPGTDVANLFFGTNYDEPIVSNDQIKSFGIGALQGAQRPGYLAAKGLDWAANKALGTHLEAPNVDEYFSNLPSVKAHPNYNLAGQFVGSTASELPIGSALNVGKQASVLGRLGSQAAFGAGQGAVDSGSLDPANMLMGGITGAGLSGALEGAGAFGRKYIGTKIPKEKKEFVEAGKRLGLLDSTPNPYKSGDMEGQQVYENELIHSPWTKDKEDAKNLLESLDQKSKQFKDSFDLHDTEGNPIEHEVTDSELKANMQKEIDKAYGDNLSKSKDNFSNLGKKGVGLSTPLNNYESYLRSIVNKYNDPKHVIAGRPEGNADVYNLAKEKLDAFENLNWSKDYVKTPEVSMVKKNGDSIGDNEKRESNPYFSASEIKESQEPQVGYNFKAPKSEGTGISYKKTGDMETSKRSSQDRRDHPDLNYATSLDSGLNQKIYDNFDNPQIKKMYSGLKDALHKDIDNSAEISGNKDIVNEWKDAKKYYKDNIVPFHDDEGVGKFVSTFKNSNPNSDDILKSLVSTGTSGNVTDLKKFLNLVPNIKNSLGYLHLNKSTLRDGPKPEIQTMVKNIGQLSPDTAKALYDSDKLQRIKDLNEYYQGLGSLRENLKNKNTGGWTKSLIGGGLLGGAGGGIGGIAGGLGAGLPGAAAGAILGGYVRPKIISKLMKIDPNKNFNYLSSLSRYAPQVGTSGALTANKI